MIGDPGGRLIVWTEPVRLDLSTECTRRTGGGIRRECVASSRTALDRPKGDRSPRKEGDSKRGDSKWGSK